MNKFISKRFFVILVAILLFVLVGCQKKTTNEKETAANNNTASKNTASEHHNHPFDGGAAPAGMKVEENPLFPVGSEAIVKADHMSGMDGAKAKIVGAFKTYTYSVNYKPTDGSDEVKDHKWVVHEELENYGENKFEDGSKIKINTNHMYGMQGAEGTVAYSTQETVYMIDFEADGMMMTNHKWVVESELVKP